MDPGTKVLTACAALLIAAAAGAGPAVAGDAAEGKKIFATTCAACHAPDGKGITGLGKPLNDTTFLTTRDDGFIQDVVMKGRPGTMMTSFAHLGEDKVRDVVAYIRAWQTAGSDAGPSSAEVGAGLATAKPPIVFDGDPNNGKRIFGEHCASCHQEIKRYLSKASDENVMRVVDIVHTDASTRSFTGAHTWATLSEAEARDIVVYMKKLYGEADEDAQLARLAEIESAAAIPPPSPAAAPDAAAFAGGASSKAPAEADVLRGQNLFQGKIRFQKGGPSCIACHHVKNDAVIGGGVLAKDLTQVFTRMGGTGVQAILGRPPFPVMEQAYRDRPLTQDEIDSVIAFLQNADKQSMMQKPKDYGRRLLIVGGAGAVLLIALYSLLWGRRKKKKVNQDVFDRQIKSE